MSFSVCEAVTIRASGNCFQAESPPAGALIRHAHISSSPAFFARHDTIETLGPSRCIGNLNHLFLARAYIAEPASVSIVGEFRENRGVASVGSVGAAVGGR